MSLVTRIFTFLGCLKSFLASMKTLTHSEDCSESRITISEPASLSVIGRFSPVSIPHFMQEKSLELYMS
jgi:hypothetical protein